MAFMHRLAPNGQSWRAYVGAAPPAQDGEGNLVGGWSQCLNGAVVFEKCNPDWNSDPDFADSGPAGHVIEYCEQCGFDSGLLNDSEGRMHEEMDAAEGDPLAFLCHRARNGMTWKEYCSRMEPTRDGSGFINGAWGDCITAAVIFEKQNPSWSNLPAYMEDGPAGQVLNYFNECGHDGQAGDLEHTEQETHAAFEGGRRLPVFEDVYQAITGTQEVEHDEEPQEVEPSGRRKALMVGCNYPGTKAELNGCINDVHMWKGILEEHYGFDAAQMVLLTDDEDDPRKRPTKANIRSSLQWLVAGAQSGDVLFFQFSGHGTQIPSKYSDEADGKDEALCPTDYNDDGFLVDNEIYDLAVNGLQSGVKLTIILDCCHSGTAVDLPFIWNGSGWQEESGVGKSAGDVQMISGCEDDQCSMDVTRHGRAGGAMTTAMHQVLGEDSARMYPDLLDRLHEVLKERNMTQIPRLTTSQRFWPQNKSFSLSEGAVSNSNPVVGIEGPHRRPQDRPESHGLSEMLFG